MHPGSGGEISANLECRKWPSEAGSAFEPPELFAYFLVTKSRAPKAKPKGRDNKLVIIVADAGIY